MAMAKKSDIEEFQKKILELTQVVAKSNKTVREVEKESADVKQLIDKRITSNLDLLVKHTEQIDQLQKDLLDLKDVVLKQKRGNAVAGSLRAKLEKAAE